PQRHAVRNTQDHAHGFIIVLVRSPRTPRTRTGPVPNQQRTTETLAITSASFALASASSRLSASLRPASGLTALTTRSVERRNCAYVMARQWIDHQRVSRCA